MSAPSSLNSPTRVLDHGFTVVSNGGENPIVDIILVHGLGGHPQRTWSTYSAEFRPPTRSTLCGWLWKQILRSDAESATVGSSTSGLSSHGASSSSRVFWPQDLLAKDFKNARVLTFGYESDPRGPGQHNLYTLSKNLLSRLADKRVDCSTRPIIFISHSLGGILTKFSLKISRDASGAEEGLRTILQSTRAVIFFATPHAGSHLASWGEILARIGGVFAVTNTKLLSALNAQNDDGQLEELRGEFDKMLGPRLKAVNFRETRPMLSGPKSPVTDLVVPLASAEIANQWAENRTFEANHRDICKFSGPDDVMYGDLKAVLTRYLGEIAHEPAVGVARAVEDSDSQSGSVHPDRYRTRQPNFDRTNITQSVGSNSGVVLGLLNTTA